MIEKVSKLLVIDASVARAAGGESAISKSKYCRDFLLAVLDISHRVVMTQDIRKEWDKHQSNFSRTWLRTMIAKKKLEYRSDILINDELWKGVEDFTDFDNQRKAMVKDLLLIEAALVTDKIIVSLDEVVRKLFHQAAEQVEELRNIVWVNPAKSEEQAISWLESGAAAEQERMLGFYTK
ncbi:hypothetical protein IQ264_10175 [Phormidium sp. LEGE 05292]|uniref:hypothetical protein n=1 Tax=[Phormidium] sp. LEGE 05292 TaxID=767427 RepID=UPI00187ED20A|nr:hypothetical protein [Phormidium sp. LEGE 05292]MBE9225789.1 hypothetical protein [Phormidium sp. LEGE 05292]